MTEMFGVEVSDLSASEARALILERTRRVAPTLVCFLNTNLANYLWQDSGLRAGLKHFVILNDGAGIDIARWIMHGRAFAENLNGTDFIPALLDAADQPLRIFLLGSSNEVVTKAAAKIAGRWPRHSIAGLHHGYVETQDQAQVQQLIDSSNANLVLIGMGNPKQERWALALADVSPRTYICVGALFDFLSPQGRRAPAWVRSVRMEWAFRLLLEPERLWRRYTTEILLFLVRVLAQRLGLQAKPGAGDMK